MDFGACECAPGGTNLFTPAPIQSAVVRRSKQHIYPIGDVSALSPIEFYLPGSDDDYYVLRDHRLHLVVAITKKDGGNLVNDDKVGFINYPLNSIFAQVDVWLNEELITVSSSTYAYRAYLEKHVTYTKGAKKSQLACELYARDTPGEFNSSTNDNKGYLARSRSTALSRQLELRGALHLDFLRQDRFLLNRCSLRIRLIPHSPGFVLMSDKEDDYTYQIKSARFEIAKATLSPALILEHAKMLQKTPARYPVRRSEIKTFSVSLGNMQVVKESLFAGQIPRRLVVGIVAASAFGGTTATNPFNFAHYGLNYICVYVDGERHPSKALTPNFAAGHFTEAFESVLEGSGLIDEDRDLDIDLPSYKNGNALYVIRLGPSEPDSLANDIRKNGTVRLEAKFSAALTATVTFIVMADFENEISIDESRNVIKDY